MDDAYHEYQVKLQNLEYLQHQESKNIKGYAEGQLIKNVPIFKKALVAELKMGYEQAILWKEKDYKSRLVASQKVQKENMELLKSDIQNLQNELKKEKQKEETRLAKSTLSFEGKEIELEKAHQLALQKKEAEYEERLATSQKAHKENIELMKLETQKLLNEQQAKFEKAL